jgi:hypothetical protein
MMPPRLLLACSVLAWNLLRLFFLSRIMQPARQQILTVLVWSDLHRKLKICVLGGLCFLHFWQCWQQGQTVHVVCTDVGFWKASSIRYPSHVLCPVTNWQKKSSCHCSKILDKSCTQHLKNKNEWESAQSLKQYPTPQPKKCVQGQR